MTCASPFELAKMVSSSSGGRPLCCTASAATASARRTEGPVRRRSVAGSRAGTGGTSGAGYLKRMLDVELFPELWKLRTDL